MPFDPDSFDPDPQDYCLSANNVEIKASIWQRSDDLNRLDLLDGDDNWQGNDADMVAEENS
jgi:hypothetical protein